MFEKKKKKKGFCLGTNVLKWSWVTLILLLKLPKGNRGKNYARYAEQFPDLLQVVGVAEPREYARHIMQKKYSIPLQQ